MVENVKTGVELIAEERRRQIEVKGWTTEHDARHTNNSLAMAAVCYAIPPIQRGFRCDAPMIWPWSAEWWKPCPKDRVRELVKAGALIAAEIDRIQAQKGE